MPDTGASGSDTILERVAYEFDCPDGPATTWTVRRMRMIEELDAPYQLDLELSTWDENLDTTTLLGGSAELLIRRSERTQAVYGIVAELDYVGIWQRSQFVRVRIVPAFALLRQSIDSRIFQDQSVRDIVESILTPTLAAYGRTIDLSHISRGAKPRDYCVQYHESDFDFVSRLLEEEGISYHFEHSESKEHEVLVFTDENRQFLDLENVDGSRLIPLVSMDSYEAQPVESVRTFDFRSSLVPTGVTRQDYHFTASTTPTFVDLPGKDDRGRERRLYHPMQRRFEIARSDTKERAQDHLEAAQVMAKVARGTGCATAFRPGMVFELDRHTLEALEIPWILTRVEHTGAVADQTEGAPATDPRYENAFECVPQTTPIRPRQRTPKPKIHGPQTAIVVGAAGDEICVDEHGRIRVQFHWEEDGAYDDTSSCWVRVAQSWAGPGWGSQFIPRVGMEVVVTFLEGNPDRPLVTGCVYNGQNAPPYALPDNKTQSGIKTNSSIGEGSNELRFEDAAGAEEIYLHGQKNWTIAIENDKSQTIGNDESLSVGHDRTKTVANDQSEDVGANKTIHVGGNHTETVDGDQAQTIGGNQSLTVAGSQTIDVTGPASETIGGPWSQTVRNVAVVQVSLASQETVGGAKNVTVGGAYAEEVGAARSIVVGGLYTLNVGLTGAIDCGGQLSVKSGGNLVEETDKDLRISAQGAAMAYAGKDFVVRSNKTLTVEAKEELTLRCGSGSIVIKKNGDITIKGRKVTVRGTSDVVVKGNKIGNN